MLLVFCEIVQFRECRRLLVASQVFLNMDVMCMLTHQKLFCKIQRHVKKLSCVYQVSIRVTLFVGVSFQPRFPENPFVVGDACLTPFCQHVKFLFVQHMDKIERIHLILNVLYQLPYFVVQLVNHTGLPSLSLVRHEICDDSCILMKMCVFYETRVCIVIECVIVRNGCRITSTLPFIYGCYGAVDVSHTPCIERPS